MAPPIDPPKSSIIRRFHGYGHKNVVFMAIIGKTGFFMKNSIFPGGSPRERPILVAIPILNLAGAPDLDPPRGGPGAGTPLRGGFDGFQHELGQIS